MASLQNYTAPIDPFESPLPTAMQVVEGSDDAPPVGEEAEYAALTGFLAAANGFRFTVLGLFVAAAGFVLQQPARWTALLVVIFSLLLWGSELRTRAILNALMRRGRVLEGSSPEDERSVDQATQDEQRGAHDRFVAVVRSPARRVTWIGPWRRVPLPSLVTHTTMIDLIYLAAAVYALAVFGLGPEHF